MRRGFQAGARGYVLKSDADDELLKALRVVIGDGSYISPKIDSQSVEVILGDLALSDGDKSKINL
jgi:DNA-binding NarL/FixJ family response regulator